MLKDLPPKEHRAQCSTNCLLCQYIEQLEAELAKCHQANAEVASINGDLVIENAAAFELLDVYEKENERLRDEYKSVMSLIAMMVHQSGGELKVPMVLLRGDEELVTWNSGMDFYIKFDDALKEGE